MTSMLRVVFWAAMLVGVQSALFAGSSVQLAASGTAKAVIVTGKDACPSIRYAAQELKTHLDRMTGGDFEVVENAPATGPAIMLGQAAANAAGIHPEALQRDGYLVTTRDNRLYIAGRDDLLKGDVLFTLDQPLDTARMSKYDVFDEVGANETGSWDFERGTLYGVYGFLESLGVRWFIPGPYGIVAPAMPDLSTNADLKAEPGYILREMTRELCIYLSKNEFERYRQAEHEGIGLTARGYRQWALRMRMSSTTIAFNHRPTRLKYEQRFGNDHPEYFALLEDGRRDLQPVEGRTGHLCYTSEGMYEETLKDIDAYFSGQPMSSRNIPEHPYMKYPDNRGWPDSACYGDSVSMLPHDSFRVCHCDRCKPFWSDELPYRSRHSDLIWQFVAKVGAAEYQKHPDKLITCLAYSSYSAVPRNIDHLPPNVLVGLCPAYLARTHDLANPERYQEMMDLATGWDKLAEQPLLYWMHHLYRHRAPERYGVPMIIPHLMTRLIRDLSAHGNRIYMQVDVDSYMFEHLHRYLMFHQLYDPSADVDALIQDYLTNWYGPAAPEIKAILTDLETRGTEIAAQQAGRIDVWEKHLTDNVVKGYRAHIDRAAELTAGTPQAKAVQLMDDWFVKLIEAGKARYIKNVREVAKDGKANISIRSSRGKTVTIDGDLSDAAWSYSSQVYTRSNIDGAYAKPRTTVRFLRHPDYLYFAFDAELPADAEPTADALRGENVEIFLDPEHSHQSYYWLCANVDGSWQANYYEARGEQPIPWAAEAAVAVKIEKGHWIAEIAIPRKTIGGGQTDPRGRPWGANFCRSAKSPSRPEDRFSSYSPLMRGRFHQPDLFGHIFFVK